MHKNARIVLVGDPKQLPPTIKSQAAEHAGLGLTLFERLQQAGYPVSMLAEQYRMHPAIARFPSAHFYNGELRNGVGITATSRGRDYHKDVRLGPLVVWDLEGGRE